MMRAEQELRGPDGEPSHWFAIKETGRAWPVDAPIYAVSVATSWGGLDRDEVLIYGTPDQLHELAALITGTLEADGFDKDAWRRTEH